MITSRILDTQALRAIVADVGLDRLMDEMIAGLGRAYHEYDESVVKTTDRTGFTYTKPDIGAIEWAPVMITGERVVISTNARHPSNPMQRNLPTTLGTTAVYDTTSGRLLTLIDGTFIGTIQSAATTALATAELSALDSATLGIIGAGAQAVAQVHAVSRVRPITKVLVFDADIEVGKSFERRSLVDCEIEVIPADKLGPKLIAEVDILCTCTSVEIDSPPVFADAPHQPWLHINATGADGVGQTELPTSLLNRAIVVPDNSSQCRTRGESQAIATDPNGPELHEILGRGGSQFRDELTVFDSTGWSLHDMVGVEMLEAHAERMGVGFDLEIQPTPRDPFDPFELLR